MEFRLGYLGRYWSLMSAAGLLIGFLLCALIFVPLIINMTLDPFRYPDHIVMSAIAVQKLSHRLARCSSVVHFQLQPQQAFDM
ncbi:MAG: hypothetical protein V7K41_19140 [Nostoc sp.]|uniref:hypothetical protein n=1 Tax=Nostoc sp. TaxID=1180 RepID=UPI002FF88F15